MGLWGNVRRNAGSDRSSIRTVNFYPVSETMSIGQRRLLTCGCRILVNPLSRLSSRCQYTRPKETLRIDPFFLAHGQRNRDVRERATPKSDDQIGFTGQRRMYRISSQ